MQVFRRGQAESVAGGSAAEAIPLRAVDAWRMPEGAYERWVKPASDRMIGTLASIVTLPLVLAISLAIVWQMGTPVIFRQRRVGRYGACGCVRGQGDGRLRAIGGGGLRLCRVPSSVG